MKPINDYIDLTLLKTDANEEDIKNLIDIAVEKKFYAICINPYYVKFAKEYIIANYKNSNIHIATVVGFPLGCTPTNIKVAECMQCINDGADEIDMVANIGAFKSNNYEYVLNDINEVCKCAKIVKVIIETSVLNKEEIVKISKIFDKSNAQYIKTSTGFVGEGAKLENIELIKQNISKDKKIKASGGIRDMQTALDMIKAGANRIGTSSAHKW